MRMALSAGMVLAAVATAGAFGSLLGGVLSAGSAGPVLAFRLALAALATANPLVRLSQLRRRPWRDRIFAEAPGESRYNCEPQIG